MSTTTKILLVGIGGYGNLYLKKLFEEESNTTFELAAVIDPMGSAAPGWPTIQDKQIPAFDSIESFLEAELSIDLAVISSPISFHADQSCALLDAGIHVLCEKPIAATMEEAQRMHQASVESGKFLEIGYQWSFSPVIQALKQDIINGRLGKPLSLKTRIAWPRGSAYYNRNNWAGAIHTPQGKPVYDSPVNNATAHFLHNMLYILGPEIGQSASPTRVTAELYRVNPIENYDTACCRIETKDGPTIYFYTSHAVSENDGPVFSYEFEQAEVTYSNGGDIVAHFSDGTQHNYGDPQADDMRKLHACIERCQSGSDQSICDVVAASAHTRCVGALQQCSVQTIEPGLFAKKQLGEQDTLTYLPEMQEALIEAMEAQKLFSEMNYSWAQTSAQSIDLKDSESLK